jgi:group I intron endonuclease
MIKIASNKNINGENRMSNTPFTTPKHTSMVIYKATCSITNKNYIGQTIHTFRARHSKHMRAVAHDSKGQFHNALRKHGEESFKWSILQICSCVEDLNEYETWWIEAYDSFRNGYNMTTGGKNFIRCEESKRRMSIAAKNKPPITEETRKKLSIAFKNRIFSDEHKQKISKAKLGKKCTIKHRKHMSESKKGIKLPPFSEEHRNRLSTAAKNKPPVSEETRKRMSAAQSICQIGRKQSIVICPYCEKTGGKNAMTRYHFENCKEKCNDQA